MNRHLIALLVLSFGVTACSERPPVDWMYAEYKNLFKVCPEFGEKVERKSSTASLTYTWSCPYPENYDNWLSEFEEKHLTPRGWKKGKTPTPYTWKTYCSSSKKVVMRIVKVDAEKPDDAERLWISIRFPGDECPLVTENVN
jgi:hypothetical protein